MRVHIRIVYARTRTNLVFVTGEGRKGGRSGECYACASGLLWCVSHWVPVGTHTHVGPPNWGRFGRAYVGLLGVGPMLMYVSGRGSSGARGRARCATSPSATSRCPHHAQTTTTTPKYHVVPHTHTSRPATSRYGANGSMPPPREGETRSLAGTGGRDT